MCPQRPSSSFTRSQYTRLGPYAYKFTGKERDTESGLDYFGFRYLGTNVGRWTSADNTFADQFLLNPQSLNLFSYVRNNPINSIDPDGLLTIVIAGTHWDPAEWNRDNPLVKDAADLFGEEALLFDWNGGLSDYDREEASYRLLSLINHHQFREGETLNIITHSFGGEIPIRLSNMKTLAHPIDNLITLAVPGRESQRGNSRNILNWYNFYSLTDVAQALGVSSEFGSCGDITTAGPALGCRFQPGAHNFAIPTPDFGIFESHGALWFSQSVRSYWEMLFLNGASGDQSSGDSGKKNPHPPKPAGRL
jgi:RHS repeat-associated protein